jgi:hypothetical protein
MVVAALLLLALALPSVVGAQFMEMYRQIGRLDLGPLPFSTRMLVSFHPAAYMTVWGLAAVALVAKRFLLRDRLLAWRIDVAALWLAVVIHLIYPYALLRPMMGPSYGS